MSVRVLSKVWEYFPNGGSELLSMLALADWSDDDGFSFPSIAVARQLSCLVQRQLSCLVDAEIFTTDLA